MNPWIDVAGWTLVHFLWQGAGIAAIAALALTLLRDRSPQTRYAVACAALAAMLAAPVATAVVQSQSVVAGAGALVGGTGASQHASLTPPAAALSMLAAETSAAFRAVVSIGGGLRVWLPLIVTLWMAGVAVLLMRLLGGWWRIRRLRRFSHAAAPSTWTIAAVRIAATLGLRRRVHVVDSPLVDTPTVIGWIRPVILMPIAALAGLSPSQVDAILAHELAHIRRHDFLVNLLQTFAETVLFYHPAVWWLSARIRIEREHCCDAVALSVCGDPVSYAEALVELERWRSADSALAVAATGGALMSRVRRLLDAPSDARPRSRGGLLVAGVVVLVIAAAGGSRYLVAAQPDASRPVKGGDARDPAVWSMIFNQADSTMRFIGYRGRDLIRFAYQFPSARVIGGPGWLDEQILEIVVSLDLPPRADEMPGIVRQTLEQRLQLKTHVEKRNFPVLALVRSRADRSLGPGLRVASRPCFDVQQWIAAGQPPDQLPEARGVPACGGELDSPWGLTQYASMTMPQFAEELRDYVRGWVFTPKTPPPAVIGPVLVAVKAPDIVDRTGLAGRYDIDFSAFHPAAALMSRFPSVASVFERLGFAPIPRALADQLGLTLVESEAPYNVIVIDQVKQP